MISILKKEFNSYIHSLVAYIVLSVFLVTTGLFVWVFPGNNVLDAGFANLDVLFGIAPYIFMFLIPAICMRSFAEEKKQGTMELLYTRPLSDWEILLGKYLAALLLSFLALIPTLLYYYSIVSLSTVAVDTASIVGSYIGLFFLAAVFTAIGVFASSMTDNQIVSFILALFLSFIFYDGFVAIANINQWNQLSLFIKQLSIDYHYTAISRGLIDSRNVLYFLSVIFVMLSATHLKMNSRKW